MFSESVAQNPTIAVRLGKNTLQNWPSLAPPAPKALGCESISPNPPALT